MNKPPNTADRRRVTAVRPWRLLFGLFVVVYGCGGVTAAQPKEPPKYAFENDQINFRLIPRTPNQMAAFYIGRSFPKAAVDAIKKTCFVTAVMRNKSNTIVWLELKNWRFTTTDGRTVKRFDRDHWHRTWESLDIPQAYRSTFRWTQLPESRDLRPDEPVGGNIVLPRTHQTYNIEARFETGSDRSGEPLVIHMDQVKCLDNPAP